MADFGERWATLWHRLRHGYLARARVANPQWAEATLRVLIVRLSPYDDVDRSTPHLFLAREARRAGDQVFIDFSFFPGAEDSALLAKAGLPPLLGVVSAHSAEDFDLVLVSCSYVLELLNLPVALERSGLPVMASERAGRPTLVLGGSSALAAQAVVDEDGSAMVDAIFFGEGEGLVERLVRSFARTRSLRQAATEVPGLWLPEQQLATARTAVCTRPAAGDLLTSYPLLPGPQAATARLQLSFGCPYSCTFCFEGASRKPYREVELGDLLAVAAQLKRASGARALELSSFNFNTHKDIGPLLLELNRLFFEVSLMSQRADVLADTRGLLELELAAGKRSYTLGVEGVSERQRRFMDKRLDEVRLRKVLSALLTAGAREAKLFYLLSGYETEEDFDELKEFLGWLRAKAEGTRNRTRLVFSFNRLIRMPFTPLQFDHLLLDEMQWQPVVKRARTVVKAAGYEFRLASSWAEYALCQVLCLGGPWLCGALRALASAGHVYLGEAKAETWEALQLWIAVHPESGASLDGLAAEKPPDHPFALGFVAGPFSQEALHTRYLAAAAALKAGAPPEPPARSAPRAAVPEALIRELGEVVRAKAGMVPRPCRLRIPAHAAGMGSEELAAWIARELISLDTRVASDLLEVRELLLSGLAREHDAFWAPELPWHGESVFGLTAWNAEWLAPALEARPTTPGGLAVLGPAAEPAIGPARLRLALELPDAFFPQAGPRLAEALNRGHVPVTVHRGEGGLYRMEPAAKARRVLAEGSWRLGDAAGGGAASGGCWRFDLVAGPRFPLLPYLRSFGKGAERRARLEVVATEA